MRESLRILEAIGLMEIRNGVGGGIFIGEVDMRTTVSGIMNFVYFRNVSTRDVTMLRFLLEPQLARIAALKADEEDIRALQKMTDDNLTGITDKADRGIGFHRYIARFFDPPLLIQLIDFVENILKDYKGALRPPKAFYDKVGEAHREIIDCFAREDAAQGTGAAPVVDLSQLPIPGAGGALSTGGMVFPTWQPAICTCSKKATGPAGVCPGKEGPQNQPKQSKKQILRSPQASRIVSTNQ